MSLKLSSFDLAVLAALEAIEKSSDDFRNNCNEELADLLLDIRDGVGEYFNVDGINKRLHNEWENVE